MALLNRFKEQLTAQNVFLDENTGGKGKYFKARFLQPGLVKYSFGVCVLEKDAIDKFIYDFVGCPVIIGHKDVTNENAKDLSCGNICHIWYDQSDGWYWGDGIIDNEEAINLINQGYNVSCQYEITEYSNNTTNALHNGNPYDKVILNGKPEHLAIVDKPRYENAMIAMNALDLTAENEDRWITIHPNGEDAKGRHLLIKDGENVYDAMQRQWGVEVKGQQHLFDRKKYQTDTNYKEELNKKLQEHLKTVQKRYDNLEYLGVAEPDKLKDEDYEDISFEEWESKKEEKKEKSILDTIQEREQQAKELKDKGVLKDIKKPKTFEEQQQEDIDKGELVELGKFPSKFSSEYPKGFTNVIKQAINEIKETDMFNKLFRKDKQMEKDEMKSLFIECLQECLKAKNEEEKEEADKEEDKKEEKEAENSRSAKAPANACKNEAVDKRDIIRQIMAIAGKEEASEDVKTIAKLAEKLAYDKSEADDKADNCKGKNEEKEDEKEKEEAKNKAKNAIDEMKSLISQSEVKKAASNYVCREDAIELGNQLF